MKKSLFIKMYFLMFIIIFTCVSCTSESNNLTKQTTNQKNEIDDKILEEDSQNIVNNLNTNEIILSKEDVKKQKIEDKISKMSLEEKVGQLFILDFRKDNNGDDITVVTPEIGSFITKNHIGGVILFSENIKTIDQTKKMINDYKNLDNTMPMFVGVDEEGGSVSRLKPLYGSTKTAEELGKMGAKDAYAAGNDICEKLKELGFNLDFAPVADINTNPNNTVIGNRSFGSDKNIVSEMVLAQIQAFKDNKIICSVKHFPGHGDTKADSHSTLASINADLNRLQTEEFIPFKAAIKEDVPMILVGHISTPNITNTEEPATFSKFLLTDILREEMAFKGVIITDALNMGAITKYYKIEESVVKCLNGGVDILLMPIDAQKAIDITIDKIKDGTIPEKGIDEKLFRILTLKDEYIGF